MLFPRQPPLLCPRMKLSEVVREHVRLTLAYFGQQREAAAEVLGITPAELDRLIAEDLSEE